MLRKIRKLFLSNSRLVLFISVFLLFFLFLVLGESYSYYKKLIFGNKNFQMITMDDLTLTLDESSTSSDIMMTNMLPQSDDKGIENTPYKFTLTNNNEIEVGYAIYLDDSKITDETKRINDSMIKYQMIKNGVSSIGILSDLGPNLLRDLDVGKLNAGEANSYSLRFWVSEEADNDVINQELSLRLRVVVTQTGAIDDGKIDQGDSITSPENSELTISDLNNLIDSTLKTISSKKISMKLSLLESEFLNENYPVGSIYKSVDNTNPSELFGGIWERYAEGRKLVGVSSSDSRYQKVSSTGGNSSVSDINISHTHNYHKATSGNYKTVISHTHNYQKATSGSYNTVISHNHSGNSLVAAIGAVNGDITSLAYVVTNAPSGLLVQTDGLGYVFRHGSFATASSVSSWSHGTKVYGNTGSTGSSSGSVSIGHTATATTSTGSSSGSVNLEHTSSTTGGMSANSTINGEDPYITVYMWKRIK